MIRLLWKNIKIWILHSLAFDLAFVGLLYFLLESKAPKKSNDRQKMSSLNIKTPRIIPNSDLIFQFTFESKVWRQHYKFDERLRKSLKDSNHWINFEWLNHLIVYIKHKHVRCCPWMPSNFWLIFLSTYLPLSDFVLT